MSLIASYISLIRQSHSRCSQWRHTHNVDVAELVEPEPVGLSCRCHEVALLQGVVDDRCRLVELLEDPLLDKRLVTSRLG